MRDPFWILFAFRGTATRIPGGTANDVGSPSQQFVIPAALCAQVFPHLFVVIASSRVVFFLGLE
jgi:hypothetical protein